MNDSLDDERQAHYAAVGRVADNWSYLELSIDLAAINLAELDLDPASCFTAQVIGHSRKLDAYISIARYKGVSAALISDLCKFAKDANSTAERRNRVLHDPWLLIEPALKAKRFEVTARKVLRAELVDMPTDDVKRLENAIIALTERFLELDNRAQSELLLPLPDTHP